MGRLEVENFAKLPTSSLPERAQAIYEKYIKASATEEVNLSHKIREEVEERMASPDKNTFRDAQKAIFLLMAHGTFDYFLRSDMYKMYKGDNASPPLPAAAANLLSRE